MTLTGKIDWRNVNILVASVMWAVPVTRRRDCDENRLLCSRRVGSLPTGRRQSAQAGSSASVADKENCGNKIK